LLGVLTVGAYGLVMYSYGVLIGPVHDETGWSIGWLSFAFTLSFLVVGVGAALAGWMLDRVGGRPVMLGALVIGSALLLVNASAQSLPLFIVTWGLGGGILGAGLFYNVTMALTTRLFPGNRVRAFAVLTFVGGFASVIYFPLSGFLVELLDWRDALRIMVGLLALTVLPAALLVPGGAASKEAAAKSARGDYGSVREAFRSREVVRMMLMFALVMMAFGAIQVHHVPAMQAAGASLATATTIAAVRGFLSLPGRALMEPVIQRTGVRGATMTAYAMMVIGTAVLLGGGGLAWILLFAIISGLAFGAITPLHGLYAAEVFGERRIGTLMGVQSLVVSLLSAMGPVVLGMTVDATGNYNVAIVLTVILFAMGFVMLATRPKLTVESAVTEELKPSPASGG